MIWTLKWEFANSPISWQLLVVCFCIQNLPVDSFMDIPANKWKSFEECVHCCTLLISVFQRKRLCTRFVNEWKGLWRPRGNWLSNWQFSTQTNSLRCSVAMRLHELEVWDFGLNVSLGSPDRRLSHLTERRVWANWQRKQKSSRPISTCTRLLAVQCAHDSTAWLRAPYHYAHSLLAPSPPAPLKAVPFRSVVTGLNWSRLHHLSVFVAFLPWGTITTIWNNRDKARKPTEWNFTRRFWIFSKISTNPIKYKCFAIYWTFIKLPDVRLLNNSFTNW